MARKAVPTIGRKPGTSIDSPELREKFLEILRLTGNIGSASSVINVYRTTPYSWRRRDKEFSKKWDEALDAAADVAEAEVRRRAIEGWDEPVFYQGKPSGVIRKYSDRMLELHIKALKPDKYRENINTQVPITIQIQGLEEAKQLRSINPWNKIINAEAVEVVAGSQIKEEPLFLPLKIKTEEQRDTRFGATINWLHGKKKSNNGLTAAEIGEGASPTIAEGPPHLYEKESEEREEV